MNVFVRVMNGPEAGRTVPLRPGQVARFGRTEWSDFGFPSDPKLAEIHFELRCSASGAVAVRNLTPVGTFLDGVSVADAPVRPGQRIVAGQTAFAVMFGFSAPPGEVTASAGGGPAAAGPGAATGTVKAICSRFELEAGALPLVERAAGPDEFVAALIAAGLLRDALRFQAFRLPKRKAVWWAWRCVESVGSAGDPRTDAALAAARRWVTDPSDDSARAAGAAAEALGYGPAAAWVAAAAFWSGDNIAPPVSAAVAPADHLTGTAVSAALILASVDASPVRGADRQRAFLDRSLQVLRGEDGPPEPEKPSGR